MNVLHYPYAHNNPYHALLFQSLKSNGINALSPSGGLVTLLKHAMVGSEDILHLHWVSEPLKVKSTIGCFARLMVLYCSLLVWRFRGKKIVWTVHNLLNHDRYRARMDRVNSKIIARVARRLLVHGESVKSVVAKQFGISEGKIDVIRHGNYNGVIKPKAFMHSTNRGVRFLFFGQVRPYKGIPELIEKFIQIPGSHELVIAGESKHEWLRQTIESAALVDDRITVSLEFVCDQELERLLGWSDVVVLPYKDILTSGSVLMALTAGRPVIAPAAGLIPEYVDDRCAFLYERDDVEGLAGALQKAVRSRSLHQMSIQATEQAKKCSWDDIGADLAKVYHDVMGR